MVMKEIVTLAAFYLDLDDVLNGEPSGAETQTKLLKCANLARGEIASDYFPLITCEKAASADGTILPSSLKKRLLDVKRVTQRGVAVNFKVYPAAIKTIAGEIEIEYSYMPDDAEIGGDTNFTDKISARTIAYGAAAEYCLIAGLFEEAVIWEKRFKDSLLAAQRKKSEIRTKPRLWA